VRSAVPGSGVTSTHHSAHEHGCGDVPPELEAVLRVEEWRAQHVSIKRHEDPRLNFASGNLQNTVPCEEFDQNFPSETVQSSIMQPKIYQFFLAMFAAFGSFLYGYDLGIIASVVASDSFTDKFLQTDATTRSGTVVALFTAGEYFDSRHRLC
jgi:hypothetical protein